MVRVHDEAQKGRQFVGPFFVYNAGDLTNHTS
jgi:hypothetical protein